MKFDHIEKTQAKVEHFDLGEKQKYLHSDLENRIGALEENALSADERTREIADSISEWLSDGESRIDFDESKIPEAIEIIDRMSYGDDVQGIHTLGLEEISGGRINEEFRNANVRQQAGLAAEVIGTAKDNMLSLVNDTGIKTFRADDRPYLYDKNDPFVDKVTFDSEGKLLERIQVRFIGHDGESCLRKLNTPAMDKYLYSDEVDKIEIPADFYDEIRSGKLIEKRLESLDRQIERVKELRKRGAAETIWEQMDRLKKIDSMLKRSSVPMQDAIDARLNPSEYIHSILKESRIDEAMTNAFHEGLDAGKDTLAKSSVEHLTKVVRQEEPVKKAIQNIAIETGEAAFDAGKNAFIDTLTADQMESPSHELILSLKDINVPLELLDKNVRAYDAIIDFGQGKIDAKELAYRLGDSGARTIGKTAGKAAGAIVGSKIPGVGAKKGAVVGSAVGTAVASATYKSAVKYGSENIETFANAVKENAEKTVSLTKQYVPEKVDTIRNSLNRFAQENNLPFAV